jgi:DNA-binding NtrC family response regulator
MPDIVSASRTAADRRRATPGRNSDAMYACRHGRIEGPFGAAKRLKINPHTLRAKMQKLGIDRTVHRPR